MKLPTSASLPGLASSRTSSPSFTIGHLQALKLTGSRPRNQVARATIMISFLPCASRCSFSTVPSPSAWRRSRLFRERFPRVELDDSRMIVESGRFATAGAALAHLDLALWLVRRRSPALATLTARYLILDARSSQANYAIPDHLAHADPI